MPHFETFDEAKRACLQRNKNECHGVMYMKEMKEKPYVPMKNSNNLKPSKAFNKGHPNRIAFVRKSCPKSGTFAW